MPADKIYDRAVEIAEQIMTTPRVIRRLTTQVIRQNRRELIARWPEIVQKLGCKLPGQD